ncbi:hypothetical protein ABZP36_033707 [Zizania latifolia]
MRSPPPANWLQLAPPGNPEGMEQQTAAPESADSGIPVGPTQMEPPNAEMRSPPPANWLQLAPPGNPEGMEQQTAAPESADSGIPVGPTQMEPPVSSASEIPMEATQMVPPVSTGPEARAQMAPLGSAGSETSVGAAQTGPPVPTGPETRAGPSKLPPRPPRPVYTKPAAPEGSSQMALPPPVISRSETPVAPARTASPSTKRPAYSRPMAVSPPETSAKETQMAPPPPKEPVRTNPTTPGVAAQMTPSVPNRPRTPEDAARLMPPPSPRRPVHTKPTVPGGAAPMTPSLSNRPATTGPTTEDAARLMPPPRPRRPVPTNPTNPSVAAPMTPSVSNRPATPADAARLMPPPPQRRPVYAIPTIPGVAPSGLTRPPSPAGARTASQRPNTRVNQANPAGSTARAVDAQNGSDSMRLLELDSSKLNPDFLRATREKNRAALSVLFDPRRDCTKTYPRTGDNVWFVSCTVCHHVCGNLDLLINLSPVSDRWVRLARSNEDFQILARGSVNCNGIILDDVWYIPGFVNVVSTSHFTEQGLFVYCSTDLWTFKRVDESVAGQAHVGSKNIYELDFVNTSTSYASEATWYLVSSAQEHMTGNLELLTDYRPMRPSRAVRTHTGAILYVCGRGSLDNKRLFFIPGISYVPGLNKNIISIRQLTDSGYIVCFGSNGCCIKRRNNLMVVGLASYGGEELFRLSSLWLNLSPELEETPEK